MTLVSTVFFCHVFGKKVLTPEGKVLGRLKDLIADPVFVRPQIVAAVVSCAGGPKTLDFSTFDFEMVKGRHILVCREMKPVDLQGMETIHVRQLMNKKIVDMDKKNTILVYDVKIAIHNISRPSWRWTPAGRGVCASWVWRASRMCSSRYLISPFQIGW